MISRQPDDDSAVQEFADFWRTLAKHYSTWDSERVFFEILNEPEFPDRYRWYGVQAKLAVGDSRRCSAEHHDRSGGAVVRTTTS